ncbi:MAG: alpha/beta-hydrolase family protein [Actinomycetota bacterium]
MLKASAKAITGFLSKPHVRAGLALGAAAAIESNQPSLIPRPRTDQALVVAGSAATGYVAGSAIGRVIDVVPISAPRPAALLRGRASRIAAGAVVASAASAGAVAYLRSRLDRYDTDGKIPPDGTDVAWTLGAGIAITAGVGGVILTKRKVSSALASRLSSSVGGPKAVWLPLTVGTFAGATFLAGRAVKDSVFKKISASNRKTEVRYAEPPIISTASGSTDSTVRFEDLGLQGRRFVSETSTGAQIDDVMEADGAIDAVRVYIGVESADTVEGRVALAIEELRRTGAFERSLLIVGSPAGTGYFNYIPVEAAEYLAGGDVASVAIQYGSLPSMLSMSKAGLAIRQHAALLDAIAEELRAIGPDRRPRIVLYGESLGAQTSQGAFTGRGTEILDELGIDRALWVGTPHASAWHREVFSDGSSVDHTIFGRFSSIRDYRALSDEARARMRFLFLDHHEDPVTLFSHEIAYRKPPWLGAPETRPPNISRTQRWVPGVTFWQTAIDTKNAATVVPGEFKAFGHDYRADLAEFVRAAYGLDGVTPGQMKRIEERLRTSEIERAARIADG